MATAPRATKSRLDQLLVETGQFDSRAKAQAAVMAGLVFVKGQRVDKPGQQVAADAAIEVKGKAHPYVSRGGLKLAKAIEHFGIDCAGKLGLDVGASTGGFTDVLLRAGAAKVYAVDVGHNQLAWSLRSDPRVVVMEKTNARHLTRELVPEPVDLVVCDASFIGLETVLPAAMALAAPGAWLVALIKPQFEVGPDRVGKGGIVRDPALHQEVCDRIARWLAAQPDWSVAGIQPSPIEGADGNREFLIAGRLGAI